MSVEDCSPLPWELSDCDDITDKDGVLIIGGHMLLNDDAALIVAAVNAMEPMRVALDLARATIYRAVSVTHELGDYSNPADSPVIKQIDAVLAMTGKPHE